MNNVVDFNKHLEKKQHINEINSVYNFLDKVNDVLYPNEIRSFRKSQLNEDADEFVYWLSVADNRINKNKMLSKYVTHH